MSFFPINQNPLFVDSLVVHQKNFHYLFALRCTLGVVIPLALVLLYGYEEYAGSVAYGALVTGMASKRGIYTSKIATILGIAITVALATIIGALTGGQIYWEIVIFAAFGILTGLMSALGKVPDYIGMHVLVALAVFSFHPMTFDGALMSGGFALAASSFQLLLCLFSLLFISVSEVNGMPADENADLAPYAQDFSSDGQSFGEVLKRKLNLVAHGILFRPLLRAPKYMWSAVIGAVPILKANLAFSSPYAQHGARLSCAMVVAIIASYYWHFPYYYWIVLTVAYILKPSENITYSRAIARTLGTLLGATIATLILGNNTSLLVVFGTCVVFSALAYLLSEVNYAIAITMISVFVLGVMSFADLNSPPPYGYRILGTVLGCLISICAYLLWPPKKGA
jgi:uncharacterized membrane protein YccC